MTAFLFFLLSSADLLFPWGKFGDQLRGRIASRMFLRCGKNLKFKKNVYFATPQKVSIGNNVWFSNNDTLGAGEITLEDEVLCGPGVCIHAENHTYKDGSYRFGPPVPQPVIIHKGTWLGANSTVLAGAEIGEGSIVAAGAVVCRGKYPPGALLAGVPAKVVRIYSENTITKEIQ